LSGQQSVYGSGDETRDYLYAGEVACAVALLAERAEFRGEAWNVASGESVTIRDLAQKIFRAAHIEASPQFTGEAVPGSPRCWRADVSRIRALDFTPVPWSSGLARPIDWIRAQPCTLCHIITAPIPLKSYPHPNRGHALRTVRRSTTVVHASVTA